MGVKIIKRSNVSPNLFRDFLIDSIDSGAGDEVLLCSGFFQENTSYRASQEKNLVNVLLRNKIKITVVGVYNYYWRSSFNNFVSSLTNAGVNITSINRTKRRWHAKVYILKNKGNGIFGIIGSSNITRPAFSTYRIFNIECDVILWDDNFNKLKNLVDKNMEEIDIYDYISVSYDDEKNKGVTIRNRLNQLEKEILSEQ